MLVLPFPSVSVMGWISWGFKTDWWNPDSKCSTERDMLDNISLGTITHKNMHRYPNSSSNGTHTGVCMQIQIHFERKPLLCILTIWIAWKSARMVPGIRSAITGLILSQSWRLLPLKFPPTRMKSSSGRRGWNASLPAVRFLQAFWFAFQQPQVSGGRFPSFWALALHLSSHPRSFVASEA